MPLPRARRSTSPWIGALVVLAAVAAACGHDAPHRAATHVGTVGALTDVTAAPAGTDADPTVAADALTAFGDELFAAATKAAPSSDNVVLSPASVAMALALLEPGATGAGEAALHHALHIEDPAAFRTSLSALEQRLLARTPPTAPDGGDPGEVTVGLANAAYLQRGYPFEQGYLDAIGRAYGPVLTSVDYPAGPDTVAHRIDAFVSKATHQRIPKLIGDGVLTKDDVLTLVNALYLKASWEQPFDATATEAHHRFTRADGSRVEVPLMRATSDTSASGEGWVGAGKSYVGGLGVQLVLPDPGRMDEVAAHLSAVAAAFEDHPTGPTDLGLPRYQVRQHEELSPLLKALGLGPLYDGGTLRGIAKDDTLVLSQVIHEAFVAMDEQGTEAAAATAAVMRATSALVPTKPPAPVVLDRPFLFRIYDQESGATLFLGRVMDPTA